MEAVGVDLVHAEYLVPVIQNKIEVLPILPLTIAASVPVVLSPSLMSYEAEAAAAA